MDERNSGSRRFHDIGILTLARPSGLLNRRTHRKPHAALHALSQRTPIVTDQAEMERPDCMQRYLDASREMFSNPTIPPAARQVAKDVFERLRSPARVALVSTTGFETCTWLDVVLIPHLQSNTSMGKTARAIQNLRPVMKWFRRERGRNGSADFQSAHVHGMICGPGGVEERDDLHLGFTIMAPNVRYPEHSHPGEEAYVLLTPGEFQTNDRAWFDPGIGGGLHNEPWAVHAMRSGPYPLLTLWCLKL